MTSVDIVHCLAYTSVHIAAVASQEGAQEPRKGPSVRSKAAHTAERLSASQALSMALTPSPPPPPPYATVVGVDAHRHVTIGVRVVELRVHMGPPAGIHRTGPQAFIVRRRTRSANSPPSWTRHALPTATCLTPWPALPPRVEARRSPPRLRADALRAFRSPTSAAGACGKPTTRPLEARDLTGQAGGPARPRRAPPHVCAHARAGVAYAHRRAAAQACPSMLHVGPPTARWPLSVPPVPTP